MGTLRCKLRDILDERGISQSELALETGLSGSTVSKLAGNRFEAIHKPTIETICRYLKIGVADLLEIENDE